MNILPRAAIEQHTAIVGKTGSGKTTTAKLLVEQVVAEGARVCILDPIKSDWWGLISSADGKRPGLPFHILGGPRGHVPLHDKAGATVAELVANGSLPLSIIDMADFRPGGLAQFFVDFAPVLLRRMKGVLYLVIEEAHLFAPKERAGLGAENMAIHWAKTLATAGRSKGIRLIVATQRTQALHNAILGSCDTLIAHRLTSPADQEPILKWLKANVDTATQVKIAGSLGKQPRGTAWICSGEAEQFNQLVMPRISTYDNTATPDANTGDHDVVAARVDVAALRLAIGGAAEEAEANDPKRLKARIAELERQQQAAPAPEQDQDALAAAYDDGFKAGHAAGYEEGYPKGFEAGYVMARKNALDASENAIRSLVPPEDIRTTAPPHLKADVAQRPEPRSSKPNVAGSSPVVRSTPTRPLPMVKPGTGVKVSGPQQRILDALAYLETIGVRHADRIQLAFLSDASPKSSAFTNNLGSLRTAEMIDYPSGGRVALLPLGRGAAKAPNAPKTSDELRNLIRARVPGPQWRILSALIGAYPSAIERGKLADLAEASATSSAYTNNLGALRSLGLIDYPERGSVAAQPILFLEADQ